MRMKKQKLLPHVEWLSHLNAHERQMSMNLQKKEVHFSTTIQNWDQVTWHFREINEALKVYNQFIDNQIRYFMNTCFLVDYNKDQYFTFLRLSEVD